MRLNVITGRRPNYVQPLINRAKALNPNQPEPYKYAAVFNINSFFQYKTALREIERYIVLRRDDPFGHNVAGFAHYRLGQYEQSIAALERTIALDDQNGYAYALMARVYALLARKVGVLRKKRLRAKARDMRDRAAGVRTPDPARIARLDRWLKKRL